MYILLLLAQTLPLEDMAHPPSDHFTQLGQFIRASHRDIYPAVDPTPAALLDSQAGKVIIITGASRGI